MKADGSYSSCEDFYQDNIEVDSDVATQENGIVNRRIRQLEQ